MVIITVAAQEYPCVSQRVCVHDVECVLYIFLNQTLKHGTVIVFDHYRRPSLTVGLWSLRILSTDRQRGRLWRVKGRLGHKGPLLTGEKRYCSLSRRPLSGLRVATTPLALLKFKQGTARPLLRYFFVCLECDRKTDKSTDTQ